MRSGISQNIRTFATGSVASPASLTEIEDDHVTCAPLLELIAGWVALESESI